VTSKPTLRVLETSAVVGLMAIALVLAACDSPGKAGVAAQALESDHSLRTSDPVAATASPNQLSGTYLLALEDGSVIEVSAQTGHLLREVLVSWERRASVDAKGFALGAREIAYDHVTGRLWYADSHEAVRSIDLATGTPGPSITGFADAALPGCGVANAARHIAVDVVGRRLIVPSLTGSVLFFDLDSADLIDAVEPGSFGLDWVVSGFRHYAVDPVTGGAWYATSDGELVEVASDLRTRTGRTLALDEQDAPAANAYREMFVEPSGRLLVYQTADGRLVSVDLETLEPAAYTAAFQDIGRAGSIEYIDN
jgi:hypothetical protein